MAEKHTVTARAPGRLDVMGGIADYSGSLVLQLPLSVSTRTGVSFRDDTRYVVVSNTSGPNGVTRRYAIDIASADQSFASYDAARAFFAANPDDHWAAYVLGCIVVLRFEEDVHFQSGISFEIHSDVPEGKGVSSSAALEVATMTALLRLFDHHVSYERIATLCQIVENRIAGAPCGIMDQMTAACGRKDHLLSLLCQPARLQGFVTVPDGISFVGLDSGVRHSVGGSDYDTVRTAAAMGYRMIAQAEGLTAAPADNGHVRIIDDRFNGYLANVGTARLQTLISRLPASMNGAAFMSEFGGISDTAVSVDPDRDYPVGAATEHPIREHDRNVRFASLLRSEPKTKTLAMMGELMYLSHASYSACGLGSNGTDRLVELVREAGYHEGLFGARITGGGSGGTVAVLAKTSALPAVRNIAARYAKETGMEISVFEGSSDGVACQQ